MVGSVRSDAPDLNARQIALMLMVHRLAGPHTVKGLSIDLNISKPAVTRALDALSQIGFLHRTHPAHDRRHVYVQLTSAGEAYLKSFAARFEGAWRAYEPVV